MAREEVRSPELPEPVGPFSQGIRSGDLVYTSGQVGTDPATGRLAEGGVAAEAEQAMRNLQSVLAAAGLGFEHVLKVNVYLADIADWPAFNQVYTPFFERPYPARTALAVAALPLSARVEVEMVARAP